VDSTLHTGFEELGLFGITVSFEYGKEIMDFLVTDLARRQTVMGQTGSLQSRQFRASRIQPLLLMNVSSCQSSISVNNLSFSWWFYTLIIFCPMALHFYDGIPMVRIRRTKYQMTNFSAKWIQYLLFLLQIPLVSLHHNFPPSFTKQLVAWARP
jgi:hypothetical protein